MGFFNDDTDPLGIKTKKKEDPLGILKKKEPTALAGGQGIFQSPFQSNLATGEFLQENAPPQTDEEKVRNYVQGLKNPQAAKNIITGKPLTAVHKTTDAEVEQSAIGKITEMDEDKGMIDPLKELYSKSSAIPSANEQLALNKASEIIKNRIAPTGYDAKRVLGTHFGAEDNNNITSKELRKKADQYDNSVNGIREKLGSINDNTGKPLLTQDLSNHNGEYLDFEYKKPLDDAAVVYYANKNPEFKKELETLGVDLKGDDISGKVSDFKMGKIRNEFLNDPDVHAFISKEQPNLLPAFQNAHQKLITDHPEFGINVVANEVSQAVNKTGFNNIDPIVNYYGDEHKKMADQVANQLYRDQPDKLAIWNKYIKDDQEKYLDAPSLLEGFASAGKQFAQGIGNTFTEPFTSVGQDIKDKWQKEAENVSAHPEGVLKFLHDTGHALGTVVSIAATGKVIGGFGAGKEAANTTAIGVGFLGDQLEQKKLMYPDSPVKAWTSALLNTGMYMAMGKNIFPASKINKAFSEVSPEIETVVKNLTNGSITREVARQELNTILKKGIDLVGGTLSKNAKITAELTGIDVLGKAVDEVMGGKPADENELQKAGTVFLSNLAVAGLAKFGEMKSGNVVVENSLDKAASEPLQTGRAIDLLNESQATKDQMKSNLDFLTDVKKKLVDDGIDPKQHSRFLFEALREKVAKEDLEAGKIKPAGAFTRKFEEQIKSSQEIQEKILNGEDVAAQPETKIPEETKSHVPQEESAVAITEPRKTGSETTQTNPQPVEPVPAETEGQPNQPTPAATQGAAGAPPPSEAKPETGAKDEPLRNKRLATRLAEAKNIPEEARKGIEAEGLKYEPKSQEEANSVAKSIIDEAGLDEAVTQAQASKFGGDVNTLVQTNALDHLAELSEKEIDPAKKLEYDKKFAEIAIQLDEWARDKAGRGIAALNHFYKKSPLGVAMMENAKRKQDFDNWAKPKEQSWKDFFDEMVKDPEFEKEFKERVETEVKKERIERRAKRKDKIDDFFDKASKQFDSGATYGTVIPPKVIKAAIEGMRVAVHAGVKITEVVSDAIAAISKELGNDKWDKDKFRSEWEEKLNKIDTETKSKLEVYKDRLRGQIDSLNEQISAKERKVKETNKTELDEEAQKLVEQRDKLKEELDKVAPKKQLPEQVIRKFRSRLKGLTDKQKEEIIRRSHRELIENGALEYDDFRKMIAEVTGRGELTPEETAKLKELVKETNSVNDAAEAARTIRTDKSIEDYRIAQLKAGKAAKELNELVNNKPDIVRRLTSMMQLNTLGLPSLINNPVYNVWNQLTVRYPVGLINSLADRGIALAAKAFGKDYIREYNTSLAAQKEFFKGLGFGTKESVEQLLTGLNRQDYIQKEVYGQQIRPFKAIRDLVASAQGKKKLTTAQKWDKALQVYPGIPAEIVARLLNVGDKPQRFAAERAQGSAFANALGLQKMDYKLFMEFPREEAYRVYKQKGLSDVEAGKKADYIRDVVIKEGQRSTFQQDNLLNDAINMAFGVFGGKEGGGIANLLKSVTISPFIKIPSNAFWSFYNLLNPEVAMIQSLAHGGNAYRLRNKGDNQSALQLRESRYWMAHAITGIALRAVVTMLVQHGIFTPANTQDDTKKEREGEAFFEPQGTVNLTKLNALVRGEDPANVQGGLTISNRWFGQFGTLGNAIARKNEDMTKEQKDQQMNFWNLTFAGMEKEGLKEAENGIFSNSSALLGALNESGSYGLQRYGLNTLNMFANLVQPATFAQISRAQMPYYTTTRSNGFMKELGNSMLQRSSVIRSLTGQYPPTKIDIWGQPMLRPGNTIQKLFGINNVNKDNFSQPIYEDAKKYNDIGFFPPAVMPTLNGKKLDTEQYNKLQMYVGAARKDYAAPYINDNAFLPVYKKRYSDIEDPEMKKKILSYLYAQGRYEGIQKFVKEYPEFKDEAKTAKEYVDDAYYEAFKTVIKYSK